MVAGDRQGIGVEKVPQGIDRAGRGGGIDGGHVSRTDIQGGIIGKRLAAAGPVKIARRRARRPGAAGQGHLLHDKRGGGDAQRQYHARRDRRGPTAVKRQNVQAVAVLKRSGIADGSTRLDRVDNQGVHRRAVDVPHPDGARHLIVAGVRHQKTEAHDVGIEADPARAGRPIGRVLGASGPGPRISQGVGVDTGGQGVRDVYRGVVEQLPGFLGGVEQHILYSCLARAKKRGLPPRLIRSWQTAHIGWWICTFRRELPAGTTLFSAYKVKFSGTNFFMSLSLTVYRPRGNKILRPANRPATSYGPILGGLGRGWPLASARCPLTATPAARAGLLIGG